MDWIRNFKNSKLDPELIITDPQHWCGVYRPGCIVYYDLEVISNALKDRERNWPEMKREKGWGVMAVKAGYQANKLNGLKEVL